MPLPHFSAERAHVVALQQADVQVQQRRTLDHRVAHIAALTTLCGAAVEILLRP